MPRTPAFRRAPALLLVGLLVVPSVTLAQEASSPAADGVPPAAVVEAGVETDAGSLYVFRGLVYSDGPVSQSRAWISAAGFQAYVWSNVAVRAPAQARSLDEVDLGVSYAFERGGLTVETAIDWYLYRLSGPERAAEIAAFTAEVSATTSYALGAATVFTRHVVDVGSYRGAYYAEVGATYDRRLTPRIELGVSGWTGWASARFNHEYIGPQKAGLGVIGAGVSVTRTFGRYLYLRPHAEITAVPDAVLRSHLAQPVNAVVGLTISVVR